jgi:hypothetical protein
MKTPIPFEQLSDEFVRKESSQYGEPLVLITPQHMGAPWTPETLIFRSSIWTKDGELVSPSFPKFFNWNEKDNVVPPPESLIGTTAVEKIDGSTLIVSKFKGQLIVRTRGTFDANIFENAREITELQRQHPEAFDPPSDQTYLFEWYSPSNKIVLDLGSQPLLYLIGAIHHTDYHLASQLVLDRMATRLGVPRPETFTFESVEQLLNAVAEFNGREGVCLYYHGGQRIKKIKALKYLAVHAFKSDLSINNLLEVYVLQGRPKYQEFYDYVAKTYDFECAEMARGDISKLCDANKEVEAIIAHMHVFADSVRSLSRKDAAAKILSSYGKTNRAGFVFSILDQRPLDADAYKKLLHQVIPK